MVELDQQLNLLILIMYTTDTSTTLRSVTTSLNRHGPSQMILFYVSLRYDDLKHSYYESTFSLSSIFDGF